MQWTGETGRRTATWLKDIMGKGKKSLVILFLVF